MRVLKKSTEKRPEKQNFETGRKMLLLYDLVAFIKSYYLSEHFSTLAINFPQQIQHIN